MKRITTFTGAIYVGVILRVFFFFVNTFCILGIQVDEAMTVCNAFALSKHGEDILGHSYPFYFATWIDSGQSPVSTYLCAFFVKIFGQNIFAVRFPSLIIGILGLIFGVKFSKELFGDTLYAKVLAVLIAISPWFIFSCVYTLDCNYMTYMIIFAMYCLLVAYRTDKISFYVLSMLFFSLAMNSYIASVLIVPVILIVMSFFMLAKKKVSFKNIMICVISMFIFSIPFIVFGMVSVGMIPEFNVGPITFGGMENYSRSDSLSFGKSGLGNIAEAITLNSLTGCVFIFLVDYANLSIGLNIFQYGNCLAGLFLIIGITRVFFCCIKKDKAISFIQKTVLIAFAFATAFYVCNTNGVTRAYIYRYGTLSIFLLPFEAIGMSEILGAIKKVKGDSWVKRIATTYVVLSLGLFTYLFFFAYAPKTKTTDDITYSDSLYECLDYCKESSIDEFDMINSTYDEEQKMTIFMHYYYGTDNLINAKEQYDLFYKTNRIMLNDKIGLLIADDNLKLMGDYYITTKNAIKRIDTSGYDTVKFGNYIILKRIS